MKDAKRELYIDGVYSALYGFDWKIIKQFTVKLLMAKQYM